MANDLQDFFEANSGRLMHKWVHYFEVYERHFSRYRGKAPVILEVGVSHGGSLQMWRDYFGPEAKIYGVDIDSRCKALEEEGIEIFIGSQSDRKFLRHLKSKLPSIDILIDDGGHSMRQQIITFEELFDHVKPYGTYLCEDLHTSYRVADGGGIRRSGSFIEFSKNFIDQLHAHHSEQRRFKVNDFTRSVGSVHYYDSIVVVEKTPREKPYDKMTGTPSFDSASSSPSRIKSLQKSAVHGFNLAMRFFNLPYYIWWKKYGGY